MIPSFPAMDKAENDETRGVKKEKRSTKRRLIKGKDEPKKQKLTCTD